MSPLRRPMHLRFIKTDVALMFLAVPEEKVKLREIQGLALGLLPER